MLFLLSVIWRVQLNWLPTRPIWKKPVALATIGKGCDGSGGLGQPNSEGVQVPDSDCYYKKGQAQAFCSACYLVDFEYVYPCGLSMSIHLCRLWVCVPLWTFNEYTSLWTLSMRTLVDFQWVYIFVDVWLFEYAYPWPCGLSMSIHLCGLLTIWVSVPLWTFNEYTSLWTLYRTPSFLVCLTPVCCRFVIASVMVQWSDRRTGHRQLSR